jgi:hypothetical protein
MHVRVKNTARAYSQVVELATEFLAEKVRQNYMVSAPGQDHWCNRLWLLNNSYPRNSQK